MPPKSACGHCGLPSCVQCRQRMQQSNYRKKKKSESEVQNKNENFQCFSQMALASRLYFERTSAMLQCLADEKGPEEIKRLDALCQRDPQTKKEGYEALRVQFERTLAEGYEFHGIARGIPQACTPGQTVGHSPHVALVPALPGFEVGPESRHERETCKPGQRVGDLSEAALTSAFFKYDPESRSERAFRRQLGIDEVLRVLGWKNSKLAKLVLAYRGLAPPMAQVFAVAADDAQPVVSDKLQSIPALPSPSLYKSPPGAKRPRVDVNEFVWSTDVKEKENPVALHNRPLTPLSLESWVNEFKSSFYSKRSTDAEEEENTDLQERFPVVCTLCGRILKIGFKYSVCSGPHRKKPWDRPVTSED